MTNEIPPILLGSYTTADGERDLLVHPSLLRAHALISGMTRMGKSREAASILLQQLNRGEQIVVIDPHGSLFHLIQEYMVAGGAFHDPAWRENVLFYDLPEATKKGLYPSFDILAQDLPAHNVAMSILDAFHSVWPELDAAPAFDSCVLMGCALLKHHNLPINDLPVILNNKSLRNRLLEGIGDREITSFFHDYFDKLERDQKREVGSTLRRMYQILFSPELRYSLANNSQPNLANFTTFLAEGKSAFVNLKFPNSVLMQLWGALLLSAIEQAALSRLDLPDAERRYCTLFVDEFMTFTTKDETKMNTFLQRTAGAGLSLYLCHQDLSKMPPLMRGALNNCALRIAFNVGPDDAEYHAPHFFEYDPHRIKDVQYGPHPPRYTFYSAQEQWEIFQGELAGLKKREAYIKLPNGMIAKIYTPDMPNSTGDPAVLAVEPDAVVLDPAALTEIQDYYRNTLFRPQEIIERELEYREEKALSGFRNWKSAQAENAQQSVAHSQRTSRQQVVQATTTESSVETLVGPQTLSKEEVVVTETAAATIPTSAPPQTTATKPQPDEDESDLL